MRTAAIPAVLLAMASASAQQDLERLVQQLGSQDHKVSYPAYQELSRRADPAMVPLIGKDVAGWPRSAQQYAVYLLRVQPIDATRALWKKLLTAESTFLRIAAAAALVRQGQERAAAAQLAEELKALPENERAGVVFLLDQTEKHDEVFAALRGWLHPGANGTTALLVIDRLESLPQRAAELRAAAVPLTEAADAGARAAALAYLCRFDAAHGEALAALLTAEPERLGPIRRLLDGERRLPPTLVEAIAATLPAAKSEHDVRLTAGLLRKQSPSAGTAELRELSKHDKPELRKAALEALGQIPGGLDDALLKQLLHGADFASALVAADVLRRRDDVSGLDVVLASLPKAQGNRVELAEVLGRFRDRRVGPPLLDLLDDPEPRARREAWSALQQLMRGLFPYRRFDFDGSGYSPDAAARQAGIATLRAWWDSEAKPR